MNIDKYLDNAIQTDNGYCYKDDNAFDNDFDAICYVPEAELDEFDEMQSEGKDKTDKELIESYAAYSRNSLRQVILEYMQQYNPKFTLEEVVESEIDVIVFQICDWQCPETFLNDSEIEYQYIPLGYSNEVLEVGDKVKYHDKEKEEGNPDLEVVWEIYDIKNPEVICISSEIGEAEVPPQELELIEENKQPCNG